MSEPVFNIDAVTSRMLIDFKRVTGTNLFDVVGDGATPVNFEDLEPELVSGFVWLAMRMSGHPDATYDEALDYPIASLSKLEQSEADEVEDPTSAG